MKYLVYFFLSTLFVFSIKQENKDMTNIQYLKLPLECNKKSVGVFLQNCYTDDYPDKIKCPESHPFIWLKYYFSMETPAQSSKFGRLICCQKKICSNLPIEEQLVIS